MGFRVIFVLVDGLGIGPDDPAVNPIHSGSCPHIEDLIAAHSVPIDAGLGVPGLPQSATGQTAIFTGVNAARHMGRHVEGFPGPQLRDIIRRHNVYDRLHERGCTATFANAYFVNGTDAVRGRLMSVTTVAALKAFGGIRDAAAMGRDEAVYQDLTRQSLIERGYAGPLVTPEASAGHLVRIASDFDLTVFEYFQTDRAGHKGDRDAVQNVLSLLDRFLAALLRDMEGRGWLFVMTSDHGNIEDLRTRGHTSNPVPLAAVGERASFVMDRVKSLLDVAPALLDLFPQMSGARPAI